MSRNYKNRFVWTPEKIRIEALKYEFPGDFYNKSGGAYNAAIRFGILGEVCSHMKEKRHSWDDEKIMLAALPYTSRSDFEKGNEKAYNAARIRGKDFLDRVCAHMELRRIYWTNEAIHLEALRYRTHGNFQDGSPKAYSAAQSRGILDQVCSHMDKITRTWTDGELFLEALKYGSIIDFRNGSPAYYTAWTRGILEQVCAHMKPSTGSSYEERKLFNHIKDIFRNTKKLRDRKVKIESRSHIKGFDIDIYIPELNKGIEFDGTRWHSFDVMRKCKGKRFWSDEDIRNYHEIKDNWFISSKGIEILHIKEEDWLNNRSECISRIEKFLGITGFMSESKQKAA